MQSPDAVRASDAVDRIRELTRQRRHTEALAAARVLEEGMPSHRDALYLLAANQRCLNQIGAALETLQRLEREHPPFGRLYQERGYCFIALRDWMPAIGALQQGVALNPALTASWHALQNLYRLTGDLKNAAAAAEHIATLNRLPPEVVQAGSQFSEGELGAAESSLREYLAKDGSDVEALRLLARIEQQRDALAQAEILYDRVLGIAPDYRAAREELARILIGRQKYAEARAEIAALLHADPGNTEYRALHATASAGAGHHEEAVVAYRELIRKSDSLPYLHLLLGHSLKAMGRQEEAIEAYHAALRVRPDFGDAFWSLANLKIFQFSQTQIDAMDRALAAPATSDVDRLHLHFALAGALESRGRYHESWTHYESGNALKRAATGATGTDANATGGRYRAQHAELNTRRQMEVCSTAFFAERVGVGAEDPDPIFIVGLPRSGSTLVEQVLASHSLVEGTQELNIIPRLQHDPQSGSDLLGLPQEEFRRLGERYLAEARPFRLAQPARPFFIDKMPNNFRHIGLIHLMLPRAKIIDVRRAPMACCVSNLKQLFAAGQEFTYSQEDIGRYYRTYLELMRHWDEVLPRRVLRVYHEDLVEDLAGNVRRLLDHCGLQFEPACLEFHKTARAVATASSEQVRRPLNRDGLNQWTNYRPWLDPLVETLGDALVRWRD